MTEDRKKLIDLVLKLTAKADSTNFDGEANLLRAKIDELLLKHDLSITNEDMTGFVHDKIDTTSTAVYKIGMLLASRVAEFNSVYMVYTPGHTFGMSKVNTAYKFYGRKQDIENTTYMYAIIMYQLNNAVEKCRKEFKLKYNTNANAKWVDSFRNGFYNGVKDKLEDMSKAVQTARQERGLVKVSNAVTLLNKAKEDFLKDNKIKMTNTSIKTTYGSAYNDGKTVGSSISIHKGVSTNNTVKYLS